MKIFKRSVVGILMLATVLMLSSAACGSDNWEDKWRSETHENVTLNIETPGGSCVATFSDVEINYFEDEIGDMIVRPTTLLAYSFEDEYSGGIVIMEGDTLKTLQELIQKAEDATMNDDISSAEEYVRMVRMYLGDMIIYDYCPT